MLEDKFVKGVFKIIITAIAIFILFLITKSLLGYNVKIFGIETNPGILKSDTIKEFIYTNTPKINDKKALNLKQSKHAFPLNEVNSKKEKNDTLPKVQSSVIGNNNKTVVGNNNGIIGDITINNGSQQRYMTHDYGNMLLKRLQDTLKAHNLNNNVRIQFGYTMGSDESRSFTNEVANFLYLQGYKNISTWLNPTMSNSSLRILYNDG